MSDSHTSSFHSWLDVYQQLRAKAEVTRGMVMLTSDSAASITFPRTTARDAFAIARVFDTAVTEHASRALLVRWLGESDLLGGEAENSTDIYVGNRSLWETLEAAALEMDRMHVRVPSLVLIDDAMRELETARAAPAQELRNAGTTLITMFSERSWRAMGRRQLEFFGALRGQLLGDSPFVQTVPATCNADVLQLAEYWTDEVARIGQDPRDTYHRIVHSCWRQVFHRVKCYAKHAPVHDTYAFNGEFWSALLLLTTQSDACEAVPMPWAFHVPESYAHRNAAAVDTGPTLDFPEARTWDEAALMQRDALAKLRGFDTLAEGLTHIIPRTTVNDVRQLASYWTILLARVGEHAVDQDVSYRPVVRRWKEAIEHVWAIPASVAPSSLYDRNTEFWTALVTIAVQVGATDAAPSHWQLIKAAVVQAVKDLPDLVTMVNVPLVINKAAKDVAAASGDWIKRALGTPLILAGVGLGGLAIAILLLHRPSHGETRS